MFADSYRKLRTRHDHRMRAERAHRFGRKARLHMQFKIFDVLDRPHRAIGVKRGAVGATKADCIKVSELILQISSGKVGERSRTHERAPCRYKWQFECLDLWEPGGRKAWSREDDKI